MIYSKQQGWKILAGQDIPDSRGKVTRYMLMHNPIVAGHKAAILVALHNARTTWTPYAEGKLFDMTSLFDKLDGGALDG